MTTPADILDALGRHDAAAMLRWGEAREPSDLEYERDELTRQLEELRALLCKKCADIASDL